jgi:hypothetical protein
MYPSDSLPPSETPASPPRRSAWVEFVRAHPIVLAATGLALLVLLALDYGVVSRRQRYQAEIDRLRASMTAVERARADQIVSSERNTFRLAIALIRRQAQLERALHLSIALDSGAMFLEREGAMLREMPVVVGADRRVGIPPDTVRFAAPRGVRTIARVLTEADAWEIPEWVYADRAMELPEDRLVVGALGPAIVLDGGAIIYSVPATGPLADSAYVMPGAVRARAEDLRAILPNLGAGMRVYFY